MFSDAVDDPDDKYLGGWFLIIIMSLNITIRILDAIYSMVKDIYFSIRKCNAKCTKKKRDLKKARNMERLERESKRDVTKPTKKIKKNLIPE
jgi:hypothetical protein